MAKISRQVGTASQILDLYVQDMNSTSGAGLANVLGSTVSYTWFHDTQAAVSTGTASTAGQMGTYSTSAWVQLSSSLALGWYQFGAPDGVFAIGDSAGIHFYVSSGPMSTSFVPLPIEIELTKTNNQQYSSSTVYSSTNIVASVSGTTNVNVIQIQGQNAVTSGSGTLIVSTQSLVGITTAANVIQAYGSAVVTSASGQFQVSTQSLVGITTAANLIQAYGSAIVTSASGQLQVSTQNLVGITTAANVIQVYGSAVVTSASGQFRVSTQSLVGITTAANLIQVYGSAIVTSGSGILNVSTQTLAAGAGDIISVYGTPIVTSAGGVINVSTQSLAGITTAANLIQVYGNAVVTSGSGILNVSTQTMVAGSGNITQVYGQPIVTSGSGIINVSTQTIPTFATSSDSRLAFLDVSVSSRLPTVTYTAPDNTGIANVSSVTNAKLAESYRDVNSTGTLTQLMYEVVGNLTSMANSGTTRAVGSVTSQVVIATYQYDNSTAPSSVIRLS